jgi:hypothetical protein
LPKCKACNRKAEEEGNYCEFHAKAYEGLILEYDKWKRALDISWEKYLNEIVKNPLTGIWAKDVAKQLLVENRAPHCHDRGSAQRST